MPLLSSASTLHCNFVQFKSQGWGLQAIPPLNVNVNLVYHHTPIVLFSTCRKLRLNARTCWTFELGVRKGNMDTASLDDVSLDWDYQDEGGMEDGGSPWEEAVIYRRNPSISHIEYCTTLERLGLGKLSTEISKSRALSMGLRVTKSVKGLANGTPVLVSLDVTRKKQKLRLDGIVRTVITVGCNRCGEPTAKSVFSNLSLLLTEEPVQEQEIISIGVIRDEAKLRKFRNSELEDEDNDDLIDLDDQLYFPPEEKEIDISKNIRDMVHVEITIDEVCDPKCLGLCLQCGMNLNVNSCQCKGRQVDKKQYGPLGGLKKQMQQS